MNRRIAGKVKREQKRAQVRRDIRAGRRMSMQDLVRGTHSHTHHEHEPMVNMELVAQEPELPQGSHELVLKETGTVVDRGPERAMRKRREAMGAALYSVRKAK